MLTRASAQWGTDTSGQRDFLMYKYTQNQWNIGHCGLVLVWGQTVVIFIYSKLSCSLEGTRQNYWIMKYMSKRYTCIMRLKIGLYWLIIPSYHFHTSNHLQDIWQNHWTMKKRSQWSTDAWKDWRMDGKTKTIYRSTYFIYQGYNHWTMKYRS